MSRVWAIWAVVALAMLGGCADEGPADTYVFEVPELRVDVLWVVDDSGSMAAHQERLADQAASFVEVFADAEASVRFAVTTTDVSDAATAGVYRDGPGISRESQCEMPPQFDEACAGDGAAVVSWDPSDGDVEAVTNALACRIRAGDCGDSYESGLMAMIHALDRDVVLAPGAEDRLRRSDAHFAAVFVSDEDDCSREAEWDGSSEGCYYPENAELLLPVDAAVTRLFDAVDWPLRVSSAAIIAGDEWADPNPRADAPLMFGCGANENGGAANGDRYRALVRRVAEALPETDICDEGIDMELSRMARDILSDLDRVCLPRPARQCTVDEDCADGRCYFSERIGVCQTPRVTVVEPGETPDRWVPYCSLGGIDCTPGAAYHLRYDDSHCGSGISVEFNPHRRPPVGTHVEVNWR